MIRAALATLCVATALSAQTRRSDSAHKSQDDTSNVAAPTFGGVAAPKFGEAAAPKYGGVAAPKYGGAPVRGGTPAPAGRTTTPTERSPASPKSTASPAPKPPASTPAAGAMTASFYYMDHGVLQTWEFAPDGSFLHESIAGGAVTGRTAYRGTYSVAHGVITIHVTRVTNGSVAGSDLVAGVTTPARSDRWSFRLLGANGSKGAVMNGVTMHRKDW